MGMAVETVTEDLLRDVDALMAAAKCAGRDIGLALERGCRTLQISKRTYEVLRYLQKNPDFDECFIGVRFNANQSFLVLQTWLFRVLARRFVNSKIENGWSAFQ